MHVQIPEGTIETGRAEVVTFVHPDGSVGASYEIDGPYPPMIGYLIVLLDHLRAQEAETWD